MAKRVVGGPGMPRVFAGAQYSLVTEGVGQRTLFVAGQVAYDAEGQIVGQGDIRAQTRQVLENLKACLVAAGATLADVAKLNTYLVDIKDRAAVAEVRAEYFPRDYPAATLVQVVALAHPDFLIEIEAYAVVD